MKPLFAKLLSLVLIGLVIIGYHWFYGCRFTIESAIEAWVKKDVTIVASISNSNEKYVLFEDDTPNTLGHVVMKKKLFSLMWLCQTSSSTLNNTEQPFKEVGSIDYNSEQFYIGVKVNDSRIKYISVGNGENTDRQYKLSLDEVKNFPKVYQYKKVSGGYAVFLGNNYTPNRFTIRAFDKDGVLIAQKFKNSPIETLG